MAFKKIPLAIDTMIRNPVPIEGINQEDNTELNIVVTENKTPKDLSNQTIKVYIRRIDGTLVEQTDQITPTNASRGEVTVKLKNSAFNKEGYALFQLDVSDSSGRITSSYATFKIGKGLVSGEAIANTNEIEALKKIEEYIKKANQELETFKQTVAEINENEATRQENEVVRVREEASRNEAEAIRVQQEATRKEKENERVQAEIKRIADEEMRRENEVLRGSKELERKQAEELRKETELLRIEDENNRKVAESKRIEAESVRVEAEKLRVAAETGRVEAENLRVTAEEERVAAETKREEGFNAFEGRISANAEELKNARSATTGEKFNSLDERIDCEVDRLNNKIEVSFLQQEDKGNHVIENTVEGMTTDMVVKGMTLQNLFNIKRSYISTNNKQCVCESSNSNYSNGEYTLINLINKAIAITIYDNVSQSFIRTIKILGNEKKKITLSENEYIYSNNGVYDGAVWNGTEAELEELKQSLLVLRGDYANVEINSYFEGIKSFGELEQNKISILSNGSNLLYNIFSVGSCSNNGNDFVKNSNKANFNENKFEYVGAVEKFTRKAVIFKHKFKPNENYTLNISSSSVGSESIWGWFLDDNLKVVSGQEPFYLKSTSGSSTILSKQSYNYFMITFSTTLYNTNLEFYNEMILTESNTVKNFKPPIFNKKDILLQNLGFDEGLRGINYISDELNSLRNVAIKRIDKREYREGDESLENIITDKTNTYYVLEEPIETPLTKNINVKSFNEKTYVRFENAISGTSSFKAPVNAAVTISRLNRENRALEEENKNLRQDFESTTLTLTNSDLELVKQNVDMDFRLMEVEFALDIPQAILSSNIKFKNKKGEVKSMARTPYEMMKIVILSGDYDREDYIHKVGKYYERGRMTKEEHDELMSLMTADEVIGG